MGSYEPLDDRASSTSLMKVAIVRRLRLCAVSWQEFTR
jgi:hypothetical protein